ncbi:MULTISPECIES: metal ABC transporter solute-binding protein, Zn/Mn family [unclassified Erysipelothrix]|uniref:metal ABC transporter solute-binding protein, Zn/Mn family n=1 Tax=unclassified Erysipelothrix TaxID=2624170 RepID=UPI0013770589|nr:MULTISPECIES: zinc ABC transporter substrate-binding protein [unclassified Erysipelothrix]MBK2402260.1 manganese transporter [Erysipelothrix sp. strain 2 (EsS2-6-Brazil)]MBK2404241.1 manganese transporter [Erysipelothrix sp. strain 2 (EsS2-7-Brazil)]NBA01296.1 zinc ABC transporter solute-binding protein [Erysipelothrix rhusiopathiae]
MKKILAVLLVSLLVLTGCKSAPDKPSTEKEGKLNVVATTTMIKDLVEIIGGDKVTVNGMMVAGVDPHLYKAKPSDVKAIQEADVVAFNGVHLEAKLDDVLSGLEGSGKNIIKLEDALVPSDIINDEEQGGHDPHIWFDVNLWKKSAQHVADKLSAFDAENKDYYQNNATQYVSELSDMDTYIKNRIAEIPEQQRVLVTAHDAFAYFGRYFGVHVEAIQGISTQSEAGIADINKVSDLIVDRKIKAIYTESSVPKKTIESLQAAVKDRGFDVSIGGEIYSDSLKEDASYIETYKINVDTIVDNLK